MPDTGAFCGVAPTAAAAVPGLLAFVYGLLEVWMNMERGETL